MPGGARGLDDGRLLERLRHDGMVRVHVANASRPRPASAHALTQPRTSPHTSSPLPHRLVPKEQITLQAGLANGLIIAGIILMTIYGPHCDSVRSIPQLRARTLPRHSLALTTRSFSLDLHPRPPPSPSPLTTHRSPLTFHPHQLLAYRKTLEVTGAEKKKVMEAKSRSFTPAQMRIDRRAMYEMVCRQVSCRPHLKPA